GDDVPRDAPIHLGAVQRQNDPMRATIDVGEAIADPGVRRVVDAWRRGGAADDAEDDERAESHAASIPRRASGFRKIIETRRHGAFARQLHRTTEVTEVTEKNHKKALQEQRQEEKKRALLRVSVPPWFNSSYTAEVHSNGSVTSVPSVVQRS